MICPSHDVCESPRVLRNKAVPSARLDKSAQVEPRAQAPAKEGRRKACLITSPLEAGTSALVSHDRSTRRRRQRTGLRDPSTRDRGPARSSPSPSTRPSLPALSSLTTRPLGTRASALVFATGPLGVQDQRARRPSASTRPWLPARSSLTTCPPGSCPQRARLRDGSTRVEDQRARLSPRRCSGPGLVRSLLETSPPGVRDPCAPPLLSSPTYPSALAGRRWRVGGVRGAEGSHRPV